MPRLFSINVYASELARFCYLDLFELGQDRLVLLLLLMALRLPFSLPGLEHTMSHFHSPRPVRTPFAVLRSIQLLHCLGRQSNCPTRTSNKSFNVKLVGIVSIP